MLSRRYIKSFETLKARLKKQQLPIVFFIITVLFYSPCALFLSNASDMNISFGQFAPVILVPALIVWVWGNIVLLGFGERLCNVALAICFSISLCIYIQSNFLNFHMPILSGGDFDFSQYKSDTCISIAVWLLVLILNAVFFFKTKKSIYSKISNVTSALLSAMQLISLITLVTMNVLTQRTPVAISSAGQFELGAEENVILFLLDSIEGHSIEQFRLQNSEYGEELADFTFFTECMEVELRRHWLCLLS